MTVNNDKGMSAKSHFCLYLPNVASSLRQDWIKVSDFLETPVKKYTV